ncbi:MAG: hypothetical protein IJO32_02290 [Bacilli bacterium]|nr:hypothetical protein [Bacilli bacterium]
MKKEQCYKKIKINSKTAFIFINDSKKDNLFNNTIIDNKDIIIININNYFSRKKSNIVNINENVIYNLNIYNDLKNIKEKKVYELTEFDRMIILFTSCDMEIISSYIINNFETLNLIT